MGKQSMLEINTNSLQLVHLITEKSIKSIFSTVGILIKSKF